MTREEAIKKIKKVIEESVIFEDELEAFDMAIKVLSRSEIPNTCGDAISRKYILDLIATKGANLDDDLLIVEQWIQDAPSVNPHPIECEERKSGNCPFYAN